MNEIDRIKNKRKTKQTNKNYIFNINKFLITVLLTIITLIILKSNTTFKQNFYHKVYEENISFVKINNLYKKYFGSSIPFGKLLENNTKATFKDTLTYVEKEKYKDGVKLSVSSNYMVPALESGMVIFKGKKEGLGNTIIIEQVNGIEVWYSNITSNIDIYDYVEKGTLVGEADKELYLTFKKNGEILNYEDYI